MVNGLQGNGQLNAILRLTFNEFKANCVMHYWLFMRKNFTFYDVRYVVHVVWHS